MRCPQDEDKIVELEYKAKDAELGKKESCRGVLGMESVKEGVVLMWRFRYGLTRSQKRLHRTPIVLTTSVKGLSVNNLLF